MLLSLFVALACTAVATFAQGAEHNPKKCSANADESAIAAAEKHFQANRVPSSSLQARGAHKEAALNVYWHVVRLNETEEGGDTNPLFINTSIDIMNYHFKDAGIRWNLVNVSRTTNEVWFRNVSGNSTGEFEMKQALKKGGKADLNVYSVDNTYETAFGWATFPYEYPLNPEWMDGVVVRHTTLPGDFEGKHRGKTLLHEAGHWCGLYHVFMNSCDEPGDYVDDTPPQEAQYECIFPRSSCIKGQWDPLYNIMDYTSDYCQSQFTPGQNQRMREQLKMYRDIDM
ncbi:hypothetical protein CCMSSC00406_0007565 [Pleurotus cornucopiae]|uniref:Uncharacterized protein n=1 Tax=Pleurotus cornucopiae TaxID=5321 RepID=A0ACB7J767_PLECO|nr:hypothetical protein CCMSSC00406_0007565 [Pleurotus cornucopiae]